jgi:hypothetical protein
VATRFKHRAKVSMVVDLTVISDVKRAVFVCHRLLAGGQIDNTQTAMSQPYGTVDEDPDIIRASVADHIAHALKQTNVDFPTAATR